MASILRRITPGFLQRFIDGQARGVGRWMLKEELQEVEALRAEVAAILPAAYARAHDEGVAVRAELRAELRAEMQAADAALLTDLRAEMQATDAALLTDLRAEIQATNAALLTDLRAEIQGNAAALLADLHAEMHRLRLETQAAYDSAQAMFRILDQANKRKEAEPPAPPTSVETDASSRPGPPAESDRRDQ